MRLKPVVFSLCLLPLLNLGWLAFSGHLGGNPVRFITLYTGEWALRFLLIALAVTPASRLSGWSRLMALRRMLGLYAFFYASLHMLSFVGLDLFFDFSALWREVLKRKYITVGMLAFVLLIPLAITSTNKMVKRLGAARWKKLHKLVYVIGPLAVLHFYWMKSSKAYTAEPLVYAGILAALLGYRVLARLRQKLSSKKRRA